MRNFTAKVNDTAPLATGVLDAAEDNVRFEELETAVTVSGIALDSALGPDTRTDMLAESMTRHAGAALACSDSGAANAYVLTGIGDYVAPSALVPELRLRFRPGHQNTGAATLNAFGLGVKPLLDHALSPLSGGELEVGREAEAMYRANVGVAGSWVLPAWANAHYVDPNPVAPASIGDGEGWAVNTGANSGNLNFSGLANLATLAASDIFARHVAGVGHKGITWAQLQAALGGNSGGRLLNVRLITISSTYTKTTGTVTALVFACAGGGGGGGYGGVSCDGGGGGGVAIDYVDLTGVATVACIIGTGGAGGAGGAGSPGGTTSFGAYAVATGGAAGNNNQIDAGTPGGVGTAGLVRLGGNPGGNANTRMGGVGGGAPMFGGGGYGGTYNSDRNGGNAQGYGGGGGGGSWGTGGAGAPGAILILEFA